MLRKKIFVLLLITFTFTAFIIFGQNFTFFEKKILPPLIKRELRPILNINNNSAQFSRPYIPALRFTADGRIGLNSLKPNKKLQFSLIKPENFAESDFFITNTERTKEISLKYNGSSDVAAAANLTLGSHVALCDPTNYMNNTSINLPSPSIPPSKTNPTERNPFRCNDSGIGKAAGSNPAAGYDYDCYKLFVIGTVGAGSQYKSLFKQGLTIIVENPKSAEAAIKKILIPSTDFKKSNNVMRIDQFLEPVISGDGRLLIARLGGSKLSYTSPSTNKPITNKAFDIVFSAYNETDKGQATDPCDIDKFGDFKPIVNAYYDKTSTPLIRDRYKFAAYPLRDLEGNLIKVDTDLPATYQWIDSKASNLMFALLDERNDAEFLGSKSATRFPCTVPSKAGANCSNTPSGKLGGSRLSGSGLRGFAVAGLWTHGKIVLLDGYLNASDFSFPYDYDRKLEMYNGSTDDSKTVMIGVGRSSDADTKEALKNSGLFAPCQFTSNTTFIDSIENRFNNIPWMKPTSPRDVVWLVSTGLSTDEIVFDDYLNPNVLINADMTGFVDIAKKNYYDGHGLKQSDLSNSGSNKSIATNGDIRIQNSATSSSGSSARWNIPRFGKVTGSGNNGTVTASDPIRLESVALGGIQGKGLWLNGNTGLLFNSDSPRDLSSASAGNLYLGLFMDIREATSPIRIFTFSDNSHIDLIRSNSTSTISITGGNKTLPLLRNITNGSWNHLGFILADQTISVFQNGNKVGDIVSTNFFKNRSFSSLKIGGGKNIPGIKGWIDDVKFIANYNHNDELTCNHARGTIISRTGNESTCHVDYKRDDGIFSDTAKVTLTSSRRQFLIFPESNPESPSGGLVHDKKRPNSRGNNFCLSCHVGNDTSLTLKPLSLSALNAGEPGSAMNSELRRQPSQPPRIYSGFIPSYLYSENTETTKTWTNPGGEFIDKYHCNYNAPPSISPNDKFKCPQLQGN